MGVELSEVEVESPLWQRVKVHLHEFKSEFPVDVVKLEFVFLLGFQAGRQLFKLFQVVGTVVFYAFVDIEFFSFFHK